MRFKAYRKGNIMFGVGPGGKAAEEYKATVGHFHTGVDWTTGWGSPVYADNPGYVYNVSRFEDSPTGWQAVYLLTPYKDHYVEVIYGHLSKLLVKPGDYVKEDQLIGYEGNFGEVYSGRTRITKEMQAKGDKRGSHTHEQYRPVRPVLLTNKSGHYLRYGSGALYRDRLGFAYEVIYTNDQKGCIDPMAFAIYEKPSSLSEKLDLIVAGLEAKNDPDAAVLRRLLDELRRRGLIRL